MLENAFFIKPNGIYNGRDKATPPANFNPFTRRYFDDPSEIEWAKKWQPIAPVKEGFVTPEQMKEVDKKINWRNPEPDLNPTEGRLPAYYDNTNGSLYKIAEQRGWNFYQADAVKRIDRALKKGNFKQDIEKTIALLNLWLEETKS